MDHADLPDLLDVLERARTLLWTALYSRRAFPHEEITAMLAEAQAAIDAHRAARGATRGASPRAGSSS